MTRPAAASCAERLEEASFCAFYNREDRDYRFPKEKRGSLRFVHEEPVVLETPEGDMIGAVVMNYSKNGLYFESDQKIKRGAVLRICNEATLARSEKGGCCAEVRWSRRLPGQATEYQYGTGVRYC
jgi:hypothetical protein